MKNLRESENRVTKMLPRILLQMKTNLLKLLKCVNKKLLLNNKLEVNLNHNRFNNSKNKFKCNSKLYRLRNGFKVSFSSQLNSFALKKTKKVILELINFHNVI